MSALFLELTITTLFLSSSPPHVQIEDDLLNSGPWTTWKSGKNSSCVDACHTQAYCVC